MKRNIKLFLIDCLVAVITITIGFSISKTFISGIISGIIYGIITELIELYFKGVNNENTKDFKEK